MSDLLNVLVALVWRRDARAIFRRHLIHPGRWTVGEYVLVGSFLMGFLCLLSWPMPHAVVNTKVGELERSLASNGADKEPTSPQHLLISNNLVDWSELPDAARGTLNMAPNTAGGILYRGASGWYYLAEPAPKGKE